MWTTRGLNLMRIAFRLLSGIVGVILVGVVASSTRLGTERPADDRD